MSIKNYFGGAIINYGDVLPPTAGVPDGALFLKTSGVDAGLYIYNFVQDTNAGVLGDQSAQLWSPVTATDIDADTLDGLDSTAFQLSSSLLSSLSALGTNGVLVKTNATTITSRSIVAGNTTISVTNGDGVAGNIGISVNQANLSLSSIGGILSLAKGGTGTNLTITQGGVIYGASTSALASTAAGTSGWLLRANGSAAPSWVNPSTLSVSSAATLTTPRTINGVSFNGSANITITANTPNTITFNGTGAGAASGTSFNGSVARTISYNTISAAALTGVNATGIWPISITGNAATADEADALTTPRTIALSGDVTGSAVFDGSVNVTIATTVANDSHTHSTYVLKSGDTMTGALSTTALGVGATVPAAGSAAFAGTVSANIGSFTTSTSAPTGTFSTAVNAGSLTMTSATALIDRNNTDGRLEVTASNVSNSGANVVIFGSTGATTNVGQLRIGSTGALQWNSTGVQTGGTLTATNLSVGGTSTVLGANSATTISAASNRIRDVADPVAATDAVNLASMQAAISGTTNSIYESGVWTPTLRFGTTTYTGTYNSRTGLWYRVGDLIFVMSFIQIGSFVGAAGNANIVGLPYSSGGVYPGDVSYNSSTGVLTTSLSSLVVDNEIQIRRWTANGDAAFIDSSYFNSGTILQTSTWYRRGSASPVTANFTGTPVSGVAPMTVSFSNTSTGSIASYLWNFGDGGTSTAENPTHQYTSTGTFTVSLTVTPTSGSPVVNTKPNYITVSAGGGGGGGGSGIDPL